MNNRMVRHRVGIIHPNNLAEWSAIPSSALRPISSTQVFSFRQILRLAVYKNKLHWKNCLHPSEPNTSLDEYWNDSLPLLGG